MTPLAAWHAFRRSARGQFFAYGLATALAAATGAASFAAVVVHVVRVERGSKAMP